MKDNIIQLKSYDFAVRIVRLAQFLVDDKKEFYLSKQIIRSGTSIGANVEESSSGYTKKDFIFKMGISLRESKETRFWLRLLHDTAYIDDKLYDSLLSDCNELISILTRIIQTSKKNLSDEKDNIKK